MSVDTPTVTPSTKKKESAPAAAVDQATPLDLSPPAAGPLSTRKAHAVVGEVRVGGVVFNKRQAILTFEALEGVVDEDGFNPTRGIGNIAVTGDDYKEFLSLKTKPEQTVVSAINEFLSAKLDKALDSPVQQQQ